jgi:hypothetical protein
MRISRSGQFILLLFGFLSLSVILMGCGNRDLRGRAVPSPDGKTYLVVDDNGGACGSILVDGKRWPYPIHVAGPIAPGLHVIKCGGEIGFEIKKGTTFHFDYWGP